MDISPGQSRVPRRSRDQLSFFETDPTNDDGPTSDRLKKAIERNRAKRMGNLPGSSPVDNNGTFVPANTNSVTRTRVARPNDTVFNDNLRRERRLPAGRVDYLDNAPKQPTVSTVRPPPLAKATREVSSKFINIFTKFCWGVCLVAMLRLLFSNGGIVDYYNRTNDYNDLLGKNNEIINENLAIQRNIDKIMFDHSYQKKLVRNHLSYISDDEFLVLFAK